LISKLQTLNNCIIYWLRVKKFSHCSISIISERCKTRS